MKEQKIVTRLSIGFTKSEWKILEDALRVAYSRNDGKLSCCLSLQERNRFIKRGIWAICSAVVSEGHSFTPLACDLRPENRQETEKRLGKKRTDEIEDARGIRAQVRLNNRLKKYFDGGFN
jgi:hypothetical protein